MTRFRAATLVVADRYGSVLGKLGPIKVNLPWWQEVAPICDAVPGATLLRLLSAEPDHGEPMGGSATYLVELDAGAMAEFGPKLQPWAGELDDEPLRHPWAKTGGPTADLEWVSEVVDVTGPPCQLRTWNLSAVWSIPTSDGTVWLKCLPPFFQHEITVLTQLSDLQVPRLVASEGHRCLMAEMPGEDGYEADELDQLEMVTALVDLQTKSVDRVESLLDGGVPDLRTPRLIAELTRLVNRLAPNNKSLTRLIEELPSRMDAVAAFDIPDTLVHGDPHGGNCRRGVSPPIWFDWGDSFIGNPLLDVAALHRMTPPAVDRWLDLWQEARPEADPRAAWRLLEPIAALRMAWVYQRFLDNIEPNEHIYHRDDVPEVLTQVEAMMDTRI